MTDFVRGSELLAQSRPAGTSATGIYSPAANRRAILTKIIVANVTGSAANASIFIDIDGTTYDQTTAVLYARSIPANDSYSIEFEDGWEIDEDANVAVTTGTGSALNFTVLGREFDAV